ncbi:MAG: Dna2/Cas4 domain-containing protein [Candidatus Methanofastidiosia archaeon]
MLDFMEKDDRITLHKAKKSKSMEKAHLYQLLYYLYREREQVIFQ